MSTEEGWLAIPGVLTPEAARDLARRCQEVLARGDLDPRVSDKRHGGTVRLGELEERLPEAVEPFTHPEVLAAVGRFLPGAGAPTGVAYRCPQPGFGEQRLHTDAAPLLQPGGWQVVTAIVALCDFGTDNGATAVVPGSHDRPDQQRLAGRSTHRLGEVLLTGAAGTAFVFCGHLLHRGTQNRSHEARPSLQGMWRAIPMGETDAVSAGFVPPPYPHDRLEGLKEVAAYHPDGRGLVDLSIGTPFDPPAPAVIAALATSGAERGYPTSIGSPRLREAAAGWLARRFAVAIEPGQLAACVGTKEWVATTPHWLRLRRPDRDTVLYPATSYPTYAMGATLAGCRAVPYRDLAAVAEDDAGRALCLWVNSPSNPTGALTDLGAAAAWGRARGVPVLSDECYAEFTWEGPPRTILEHGTHGVLAAHSLSKRSNLAGVRAGFYAGDGDLVAYLSEVRKHAGFMVPGPVQAAAAVAFDDDGHVDAQRERYRRRLALLADALGCPTPAGAFYLWVAAPDGDGWGLAARLARQAGCLTSPGEFYGPDGAGYVRLAVVQPDERLAVVVDRLGAGP